MNKKLRCCRCGAAFYWFGATGRRVSPDGEVRLSGPQCPECKSTNGVTPVSERVFKSPMVEETAPIGAECECSHPSLPLQVVEGTLRKLATLVDPYEDLIDPDDTLFTVRCRSCRQFVHISISDVGVVSKEGVA